MQQKPVLYTEDAIVISVPTKCHADLHEQLLQSLTIALEKLSTHPELTPQEKEAATSLSKLLMALLPTARQLENSFANYQ